MSASKINNIISRKQRGYKVRSGDTFYRSSRIVIIDSADGADLTIRYTSGKKDSITRKDFLSRKVVRVQTKSGDQPTIVSIAKNVANTKNIPQRAKISLLRGLEKNSDADQKAEISSLLQALRSNGNG